MVSDLLVGAIMKKYAALFVRGDSAYKNRALWDCYDISRDALSYCDDLPVVCHPPCRAWGQLSHMAKPREGEEQLALWSIDKIREVGGILEHPKASRLFGKYLPDANEFPDKFGGFTILIDQYDFGHVAHKPTKLYFCGLRLDQLPPLPPKDYSFHYCDKGKLRSIDGQVTIKDVNGVLYKTTRCTQYQREYTPEKLIDYIEAVLDIIRQNKGRI